MFEKVNPSHPDKVADRIAGAIVDLAYNKNKQPKIAVEVLIGHGNCHIISETSEHFTTKEIKSIVDRITNDKSIKLDYQEVPQDKHLAENQSKSIKCGDNGIFAGCKPNEEEKYLTTLVKTIYAAVPYDGKYIIDNNKITMCQSHINTKHWQSIQTDWIINPLGDWIGGWDVDCGATNRKLGSDMGRGVTGGGLHGKDLSKADVSVNIYCFLHNCKASCSIGDENVRVYDDKPIYDYSFNNVRYEYKDVPYVDIVNEAKNFIDSIGGFEKFAEWGLIR